MNGSTASLYCPDLVECEQEPPTIKKLRDTQVDCFHKPVTVRVRGHFYPDREVLKLASAVNLPLVVYSEDRQSSNALADCT